MKSLTILTQWVLKEYGDLLRTDTSRDWVTVATRSKNEGTSFLTITLPDFAHTFEGCLSKGKVLPSDFPSFKRARRSGSLPAFLQGFLSLVFDQISGELVDVPSTEAIQAVRQICLLHSKVKMPTTDKRERRAFQQYVDCEKEMHDREVADREGIYRPLRRCFLGMFGDVCNRLDRIIYDLDDTIVPKHGPGSTADRLGSNERWRLTSWPLRLEAVLPAWFMAVPNEKWAPLFYEGLHLLEPGDEPPVKVISVPKTLKTPRIIAMEPAHMQYVQQALKSLLVPALEADPTVGKLIYFTDQTPNQRLAREGSITGDLATLDLKEASDRVSNLLVCELLEPWPHLSAAVQACRSTSADVPGHGIIPLTKFASMGSALTFPLEAMIFLTIVVFSALMDESSSPAVCRAYAKALHGKVAVYGDDLIVPTYMVQRVMANLELFGFQVNARKSFWSGRFRESCGKEYYAGDDVSVVKSRAVIPQSREHAAEVASWVATRNQFYWSGMWSTARRLDGWLERLLKFYPTVPNESSVLGRQSAVSPCNEDHKGQRYSTDLQVPVVRGWVLAGQPPIDEIDDIAALNKVLVSPIDNSDSRSWEPTYVVKAHEHLMRAGRPKALRLSLRWTESY